MDTLPFYLGSSDHERSTVELDDRPFHLAHYKDVYLGRSSRVEGRVVVKSWRGVANDSKGAFIRVSHPDVSCSRIDF